MPVGPNGEAIHVQDTHPALVAAMNFMKPIIEKYCKDEINSDEIVTMKKDALKAIKDAQPKKRAPNKVKAKPSASTSTAEENKPKRSKSALTKHEITTTTIAAKTEGGIAAKTEGGIAAKTEAPTCIKVEIAKPTSMLDAFF